MKKKIKHSGGYILLYMPEHHEAALYGYIYEHRYKMEQKIGRKLKKSEIVHHKNSKKYDNRICNLELIKNQRDHKRIHFGWKKRNGKWYKVCSGCKKELCVNKNNFTKRPNGRYFSKCKECVKELSRKLYKRSPEMRRKARENSIKQYFKKKKLNKK